MRLAYELAVGKRVSDNHWYLTRRLLSEHKLELSTENVQFWAELRQQVPKTAIGVHGLLEAYHRANKLLDRARKNFKGSEVTQILFQFGITPNQSTISRWFKSLGGYKKNREYQPKQIKKILIRAFIYKAQNSTKLPQAN